MPVTVTCELCSIQAQTSLYSLASFMFCTCMYTVMTFFFYHVCNSQLIFPILWDRETVFTEQWTDPDPVQRVNDSNWRILRLFIIFHFFFFLCMRDVLLQHLLLLFRWYQRGPIYWSNWLNTHLFNSWCYMKIKV